ncbi:MAG: hypothetical protein TREMPRED_002534, partial [Tremellales sp. Tagirdzhanova-0007]
MTTRRQRILLALTLLGRIAFLYRILRLVLVDGYRHVRARGLNRSVTELYARLRNAVFQLLLKLPSSRAKISSELAKTKEQIRTKLAPTTYPDGVRLTRVRTLPENGRSRAWLEEEWRNLKLLEKGDVNEGR